MLKRCWIITGGGGQLGRSLGSVLRSRGDRFRSYDRGALDIADRDAALAALSAVVEEAAGSPLVLVNAAAYTHVDRCETERDEALRVNAEGPRHLAEICETLGIELVHCSTDYVFNGESSVPYVEEDVPAPLSVYGVSKLQGERAVLDSSPRSLVLRTSWLFGPGRNFTLAILDQAAKRRSGEVAGPLRVVDDQRGCPTYTGDLAEGVVALVEAGATGLFHLANAGSASWWELAREVLDRSGYEDLEVERIATEDLDLPAPRPADTVLSCAKAARLGVTLRPWPEALAAYLSTETASR